MSASTCPDCGADYPSWHSPAGQLGTRCDECGYISEGYLPPGHRDRGQVSPEPPWDTGKSSDL